MGRFATVAEGSVVIGELLDGVIVSGTAMIRQTSFAMLLVHL